MRINEKQNVRSILIRGVNWLGDAVMTTPALGAIRAAFPSARITLLATPLVAELFSPHSSIDEVMLYDKKERHAGLAGRLRLARELKKRRFDMSILLQNALDAALITWLAGIPVRLGYRTDCRGILLSHGCPVTDETRKLHHVDYYLRMLDHFGIIGESKKPLTLTITEMERREAAHALHEAGIDAEDFVLGINPGATYGSAKRWYPDRFAEVADELSRQWKAKIVIIGSTAEKAVAEEIESSVKAFCLNLAGRTSIRQLMAVIERCNFFVTNDSGPMHIAAAFGIPLVAIFGPTDHTTTSPLGDRAVVVRQDTECAPCLLRECPTDHRCMTEITADKVVEEAVRLWSRLTRSRNP